MTTATWDQQPKESSKAFLAFIIYRDMGLKRSCQKVANTLKRNLSSILELSKRHNWQERVSAWDAHVDRRSQSNQIDAVKAMKDRQINLALKAQKAALRGLKKLLKEDLQVFKPDALAKLLDTGYRLERLNRNEPEQNLELLKNSQMENLSLEEMEMMRQLILKAGL